MNINFIPLLIAFAFVCAFVGWSVIEIILWFFDNVSPPVLT